MLKDLEGYYCRKRSHKGKCLFFVENSFGIHLFKDPWIPNWPFGIPQIKEGISTNSIHRVAELRINERQWNLEILQNIFTDEMV